MACSLEDDLRQFPDACDAVRVGSERWQTHHSAILETLVSGVRSFLRSRKRLPIDQLLIEYERNEPSVEADGVAACGAFHSARLGGLAETLPGLGRGRRFRVAWRFPQ